MSRTLLFFCAGLAAGIARAGSIYHESLSGDFSGDRLNPTMVNFSAGHNEVHGTTGAQATTDRDYFTFVVPNGLALTNLMVLGNTAHGNNRAFIGIQAGPQVTVPTNAATAAGLLGYHHYRSADIGTDILPLIAEAKNGASGFPSILGPGTYSVWIQEVATGVFPYHLDFVLSPEPGTWALMAGGLAAGLVRLKRASRPR